MVALPIHFCHRMCHLATMHSIADDSRSYCMQYDPLKTIEKAPLIQ